MSEAMSNRIKNGIAFEKEAFEILKEKFEKVNWLSERGRSPYDFECFDSLGNKYNIEAKSSTTAITKIVISSRQINADYIIFKNKNNEISFVPNKDFKKYFYLEEDDSVEKDLIVTKSMVGGRFRKIKKYGYTKAIALVPSDMIDFEIEVGDSVNIDNMVKVKCNAQGLIDSVETDEEINSKTASENLSNILAKRNISEKHGDQ